MSCKALLRRGLALLAAGLLSAGLAQPVLAYQPDSIVGQPNMLLTAVSGDGALVGETTLGDATADAIRQAAGSDLAILGGGELLANLEPKETTFSAIQKLYLNSDQKLAVAEVTAAQLKALLEQGFSHIALDETESIDPAASSYEGFPQISGIKVTYDASAHPGERVMRILVDGTRLDLEDQETRYTLAAPETLLNGAWSYPVTESTQLNTTLAEAMADFVAAGTPDDYTGQDRIVAVGCTAYNLTARYPIVACVVAAIVIWCGTRLWKFKKSTDYTR